MDSRDSRCDLDKASRCGLGRNILPTRTSSWSNTYVSFANSCVCVVCLNCVHVCVCVCVCVFLFVFSCSLDSFVLCGIACSNNNDNNNANNIYIYIYTHIQYVANKMFFQRWLSARRLGAIRPRVARLVSQVATPNPPTNIVGFTGWVEQCK